MPHTFPNVGKCCGMLLGRTSRSVNMGLRPTNSDENQVGRARTPAAGLQTRLFPNRLRWVFDCARVLQDPLLAQRNRRAWTPAPGLEARPTINAGVRLREKYAALGGIASPTTGQAGSPVLQATHAAMR